jgi:hypothetical protein
MLDRPVLVLPYYEINSLSSSRALTATEDSYAQIKKELLAIVYACENFNQYILGKSDVVVKADHKPLETIFKKPNLLRTKEVTTYAQWRAGYYFSGEAS